MNEDSIFNTRDTIVGINDNINKEWSTISLTFVEYPKGDTLGQFLAWMSLTPIAILSGFAALIASRRDLHTITFFIGILGNEILNKILKKWIKEPRPTFKTNLYSEYGMPSSHSQFISFFSLYLILFVYTRLKMTNNIPSRRILRLLIFLFLCILTCLVCFSRIYLGYHTSWQVIAGIIIGIMVGAIWFTVTQVLFVPIFPRIVTWKISELLLLRDTTLIPNILWFEYTVIRQESRARARKLMNKKSQ